MEWTTFSDFLQTFLDIVHFLLVQETTATGKQLLKYTKVTSVQKVHSDTNEPASLVDSTFFYQSVMTRITSTPFSSSICSLLMLKYWLSH